MLDYSEVLQELFPDSPLFDPASDEGLDQYFDGWAAGEVTVQQFLAGLAHIRDPYLTPVLSALEREFGQVPNSALAEEFRRAYLAAIKYSRVGNGDKDFLQDRLHQAGFTNALVHINDPRADPRPFVDGGYLMYAGDTFAQAGEVNALAGGFQGEILVNGDLFHSFVDYINRAGDTFSQAGEPHMLAGNFAGTIREPIEYELPDDPLYWPVIFFVGGPATVAPPEGAQMMAGDTLSQAGEPTALASRFNGQITEIEFIDILRVRRDQFRRLILRIKPLHSWAVLCVNYV
jgi:hypothetical protein